MKKISELTESRIVFGIGLFLTSLFVVLAFVKPPSNLLTIILFPIGFVLSVAILIYGRKEAKKAKAKLN